MFVSSLLPYIRECCFVGHLKSIIYYTDVHDVDENLRTIVNPGGDWILGGMVGIMFREMRYDFTAVHATAASVRRHP